MRHESRHAPAVLDLHAEGLGQRAIARRLGLTHGCVAGILWRRGEASPKATPDMHASQRRFTDDEVRAIRAEHRPGIAYLMARERNVDDRIIRAIVKRETYRWVE